MEPASAAHTVEMDASDDDDVVFEESHEEHKVPPPKKLTEKEVEGVKNVMLLEMFYRVSCWRTFYERNQMNILRFISRKNCVYGNPYIYGKLKHTVVTSVVGSAR